MTRIQQYTTLYVVRHGETEWNVKKLIQGHKDSPLTYLGEEQAKGLAKKLEKVKFDAVYSSDSLRAKRTAQIITLEKNIAIKTTEALRERNFGSLEGKPVDAFQNEFNKFYKEYIEATHDEKLAFKFADAETESELISRVITFLREIAIAHIGETVLVTTHGGVLRALLIHFGYGSFEDLSFQKVKIKNTAYIKLRSDGVDFFIDEVDGIEKF